VSGAEYGAAVCPSLTQTQTCNTQPCPIDCIMNDWGSWGACSNPCTCEGCPSGVAQRTRTQKNPPANGGSNCGTNTDTQQCNTQPCPIDCVASDWSDFDACSNPCGGTGVHTRTKPIIKPAQFGGVDCSADSMRDVAPCNTMPCPIDCKQDDWSGWTDCSRTCGTGTQQRARQTTVQPNYGGSVCGPELQAQDCNKQACPVDCQLSDWSSWGTCDSDCGTGSNTRTRSIVTAPTVDGAPCGDTTDEGACNTQACPVDKLATLVKRIRHLELQDRVGNLETQAITDAQNSVAQTVGTLAAAAVSQSAIPATSVSTLQISEHVTHRLTMSQKLSMMHPTLVLAAHPYSRPSITQLLQSEVLVDELAKWAEKQDQIERRTGKKIT